MIGNVRASFTSERDPELTLTFYVLTALTALASAVPGTLKIVGHQRMRAGAEHFGIPWNQYRLIGFAEAAATIGVLVGLGWRPLGIAAGIGLVLLMLGALGVHLRARDKVSATAGSAVALAIAASYVFAAIVTN